MNDAGITAQYGFLFQRKAFILFALENAGTKQTFIFEGKDDIEISADESIYSVKTADSRYVQVKSGSIKHLREDLQDTEFSLEFDPFRLYLFASHKEQGQITHFMPGSMARQTHLQILTYLCMFEYLKDKFPDFIYLPILH